MQTFRDAQSPETRRQPTETRKPLRLKIRLPDNLLVPSSVSEPCILQVCLKRNRNPAFAAHLPERGSVTGCNPGRGSLHEQTEFLLLENALLLRLCRGSPPWTPIKQGVLENLAIRTHFVTAPACSRHPATAPNAPRQIFFLAHAPVIVDRQ